MSAVLNYLNSISLWVDSHPLETVDIFLLLASAVTVFLCRYAKHRDSIVGTALFICWVYQIYETLVGDRISAPSDVLFDGVIFLVIFSAGGNIMSIVVISKLIEKAKSIWLLMMRPFTFKVKK